MANAVLLGYLLSTATGIIAAAAHGTGVGYILSGALQAVILLCVLFWFARRGHRWPTIAAGLSIVLGGVAFAVLHGRWLALSGNVLALLVWAHGWRGERQATPA